jgi:hypothetical protein
MILFIYWAGVEPSPLFWRPFIGLLYQPGMTDGDDCMAVSGTNEWQGKPRYSEETCPNALCPLQIPHDVTQARARPAAVGSQPEPRKGLIDRIVQY